MPEPYIYVTNNTGNRAIIQRCSGSPVEYYVDDTMPEDAVGCVLVAHVVKGSAAEAWQCFMDGRMEGAWGVMEKIVENAAEKPSVGVKKLAVLVLAIVGAVYGAL